MSAGGGVAMAQEEVNEAAHFAYPNAEGVVWIDGLRGVVAARAGQEPEVVFSETGPDLVAVSGQRLVMGWTEKLFTFPAGSWTPRVTETGKWIVSLGASSETALAFDAESGLWRLQPDGSWRRRESGIADDLLGLAWSRGLWVAVGSTRGIDPEDGEEELRYGGTSRPHWETEQRSPRIWWSSDGVKWQPASLPDTSYGILSAVTCLKGQWLAASKDGTLYGSTDGKSWERVGSLRKDDQWSGIRLVGMGDEFLIRFGEEPWRRSADGRSWRQVPLAEGARVEVPFMKDGQLYAVGKRKADRRLEAAPLADFAEAPGPTAAELAAKAADDEKARLTAEAEAAAAQKLAEAKALADQQAAESKQLAQSQHLDTWARDLARWDVAIADAQNVETRLRLARELHVKWKATHPGYTQADAVTYLTALFGRVTGYEYNDTSVYEFIMESMDHFGNATGIALTGKLPRDVRVVVKQMAVDVKAAYQAKQAGQKPPVAPSRVQVKKLPVSPQRYFAPFDIEPVRLLAARGDGASCYDLGLLYLYGQGVPVDKTASRFWIAQAAQAGLEFSEPAGDDRDAQMANWLKLAEQGSRGARYNYAIMLRDRKGDPEAALEQLKLAAAAGLRNAMLEVYKAYLHGQGTEIDIETGRTFLNRAVEENYPLAIAELGWSYEAGAGVPRDLTKAAGLYRRAAELGSDWAMGRYAAFLLAGHGVPVDEAAGRSWMRKAADKGDKTAAKALTELANNTYQRLQPAVYVVPKALPPIFDIAKRRQQVEAGDAAACYDLAYAYWNGVGVIKDNAEGNRWLEQAKAAGWNAVDKWKPGAEAQASWRLYAEQGSIVAMEKVRSEPGLTEADRLALIRRAADAGAVMSQRILGILYRDGIGVPVDKSESAAWFRRAAEIGDPTSQRSLGYAYETGTGIAQDDVQAMHWYGLAAEADDEVAMANLANLLTLGRGAPANPKAAASWYLRLAGLPAEEVSAEEAAARIRAAAEKGDAAAFAAWGIVLRRGFGVPADNQTGYAYGFVASALDSNPYGTKWFQTSDLRRAPAFRQAAGIAAKEYVFYQNELSADPTVAANIASGKFPTFDALLALAAPEKSAVLRALRAIEDNTFTDALAAAAEDSREPFALTGFDELMAAAEARPELAGQTWLLRLAGVATKPSNAAATEKLFQQALIAPPANLAAQRRLQTLRRIAAARLYYGVGHAVDRPAALAWALSSVTDEFRESLFAVELLSRELSPGQIDSADELYLRITKAPAPALTFTFASGEEDDDLFASKPGARPDYTAKVEVASQGARPSAITARRIATGEAGIETWKLEGLRTDVREVTFARQTYAAGTINGTVLLSADGIRWETTKLATNHQVSQILHDGRRWIALTTRATPYLHYSEDGKNWTANPAWNLHDRTLVVKDGRFWSAGLLLGGLATFSSGALDAPTARAIPNHDGQLSGFSTPVTLLQSGGQLFAVRNNGTLFASDNGDYWTPVGPPAGIEHVHEALIAEGNDRAVLFLMDVRKKPRELVIRTQTGGQVTWDSATNVPFTYARSLAYGGGRFVVIGINSTGRNEDAALYESTDGLTWTRVAALEKSVQRVAFGPAGFIIGGTEGTLFVYKPAALPEKPAFVRAATPLPPITIKDFGRNYVGKGKYRKVAAPETPEQIRVQELETLYPKALQGDATAKREIAMESIHGKYVVENPWVAEKWLKDAIAAGDPIAPRGYARLLLNWKTDTSPEVVAALHRQSAERGDALAMVWMVETMYGTDVVPEAERKKWAPLAAEKDADFAQRHKDRTDYAANLPLADAGNADACYRVAQLLVDSRGIIRDTAKAETYLRKAIAKKHPESMLLLATLFEQRAGTGAFASDAIATEFRELVTGAAEAGNRDAMIRLAGYLAEGQRSFDKDHPRAYAIHLKLAESGYAPSMAIVGRALYTGSLATKDEAAGLVWIRKAAEANDRSATVMLVDIEKLNARDAARPPLDAKVDGVTSEVLTALKSIQSAPAPAIDEAALRLLIDAVWRDADYSNLDEDLAQELAAAARPVVVTAADGQSMSFTKPLPAEAAVNFSQILPVNFQPTNLQFYFVLWQRTANAGLLVGGTRVSAQAKSGIEGALAKGMYDMATKSAAVATSELTRYFAQLKASHDAASPEVQKDFRDVIRRSLDTANRAAEVRSNVQLKPFTSLPWLKEP